jgi:hypothetical protein
MENNFKISRKFQSLTYKLNSEINLFQLLYNFRYQTTPQKSSLIIGLKFFFNCIKIFSFETYFSITLD